MAIKAQNTTEPIPGYQLEKRIGAGGYGEVWSAIAPGGLAKAIKFVYGYLDDERASREMKALTRIKEVRHPFLLSLERIEVVDGRLLIVTELADGSLKDRFDECKASGLPGIPRDELLMYLSDAADALDYMSEKYSLQHLDVKPENLLLVGGRVKVADFGLVKELHDVTGSLMGGLTPLYAPPESFDGRPSLHSDQYSLAVVYQEMLTSVVPFPGTTAAQLASQHLHSKPRISALPARDQAAVARALAKGANDRFGSCRAFVAALARGVADAPASGDVQNANAAPSPNGNKAAVKSSAHETVERRNNPLPKVKGSLLPPVESTTQIRRGAPVVLDDGQPQLRPTLIVGIGGVGSRVLLNLRHRLCDRLGDAQAIPALQMLLIDTDAKELAKATHGEDGSGFDKANTLPMPLKRPQDYRSDSKKLTQSLSRRWLYNLPRSLQTEGMRPLGRLALIDHSEQLFERLRAGLRVALNPESISTSAHTCGIEFDAQAPQVFVVASIDGGAGSGMAADVGYSIRSVLRELQLSQANLSGVLMHATGRNPAANELAIANAFSCLREIAHYGRSDHRYGGDPSLEIGAFEKGKGAFDATYLIHLGDELSDEQFQRQAEQVAEYLYLDTVTPSAALFSRLREDHSMARATTGEAMQVRTFGLCHVGLSNGEILSASSDALCQRVVQGWLGDPVQPETNSTVRSTAARLSTVTRAIPESNSVTDLEQAGVHHAKQIGLAFELLCDQTHGMIHEHLSVELYDSLRVLAGHANDADDIAAFHATNLSEIEFRLGYEDEEGKLRESPVMVFPRELLARIDERVQQLGDQAAGWVLSLLDDPKYRWRGAQQVTNWYDRYLMGLRDRSQEAEAQLSAEAARIKDELTRPIVADKKGRKVNPLPPEFAQRQIQEYARLRLFALAFHGLRRIVSALRTRIKELSEQLHDLRRQFDQMVDAFDGGAELDRSPFSAKPKSEVDLLSQSLTEKFRGQLAELAIELDRELSCEFLSEYGGLQGIVGMETNLYKNLAGALRRSARGVIMEWQANSDVLDLMLPAGEDPEQSIRRLCRVVEAATPKLMQCGGAKRMLLIVPPNSNYQRLQEFFAQRLDEPVSVALNNVGDAVVCCEMEQMSMAQVAAAIVDNRPDYAEIASRLHTRNDITWSPW